MGTRPLRKDIQDQRGTIEHTATTALFDIAFLDPPFADEILYETCRQLQQSGALKAGAKVYLENELPLAEDKLAKCNGN